MKLLLILTGALFGSGAVQGYLVAYGLVNPVFGGVTLPFVSAGILLLVLWVFKKYGKAEVSV